MKTLKNVNQSEEKAENANSFLEVCLMQLDQGKIINCVLVRILHSVQVQDHFGNDRYCVAKKLC